MITNKKKSTGEKENNPAAVLWLFARLLCVCVTDDLLGEMGREETDVSQHPTRKLFIARETDGRFGSTLQFW